ncbi:xanthine dehydrogenase family protein molybdopterin-binding subunit [Roseomonas chloroacetimidivorans]|uniref:xanthine dehydrogenase family protein molybdopterin-binding subunit n=1 Tax=Roseomonas chloroacetimidivorans TaxID=1766656 RepID=UPI003C72CEAE
MADQDSSAYIGRSQPRREDEYLLRGLAQFVDDLPEPQGTLHLGFVLSPHAHARILSLDASAALAVPGVVAVLGGRELAGLMSPMVTEIEFPGYHKSFRDPVPVDKVRFVGEQVAVILAENPYAAQDAIELVQVEYEVLPATASLEQALEPDAPLVHDHIEGNVIFKGEFSTPAFEDAFASGDLVLRERFRSGRVAGVPIEPRGCLAVPDHTGSSFTFYSSTQIPHLLRTGLAKHLNFPESRIRVIVPEVGGGFGTKAQFYPEELVTAALCLKYRCAVKWIQDRREELLTNIHARDHIYELEVAVSREGVVKALKLDLVTNAGAYSTFPFGCTLETTGGARMIVGPYKIRNYAYRARAVATHTCPSGAYRGVAQPTCFFAMEGMMDRIGRTLGIDPAEVRLRNIIPTRELPWVNVVGVRYDTGSYEECLRRAMELVDYEGWRRGQPADRLVDGKYRGIGICCFTEISGTGAPGWRARGLIRMPGFDSSLVRVEPTGKVVAYVSHAAAGQGHLTTFAQILADQVGARIEDVTIIEGDTSSSPYGTNTFASRSAVTGGGAVIRAGQKVAAKMRRIAAHVLEAAEEDIVLRDGRAEVVGVPEMNLPFAQIAETAYSMNNLLLPQNEEYGLEATDYYDPPLATMANAVHIASVAVDALDGQVSIERYAIVHDCGRIINPMIVDGQIHGGTAQGVGEALMEEIVYDERGQLVNANLLEYLLPLAPDLPDYRLEHIESPSIDAVGGFKGVGEGGVIGAVPAIANAVADALSGIGANVNRIPMRPSYLAGLIRTHAAWVAAAAAPEDTRTKAHA